MAKKSKTQRAKASAARAERREQTREADALVVEAKDVAEADAVAEAPKKKLFKRAEKTETPASDKKEKGSAEKKIEKTEKKPEKKRRFGFLKDVRSEMKRVTWPTKKDVFRWSIVVVAALAFFGVYVAVLDNFVITPVLVAISGLGA